MSEVLTLYKLIILYMLYKMGSPLTNAQISEFMVSEEYTSFFQVQKTLGELEAAELLEVTSTHSRTLYALSPAGEEAVCCLKERLSDAIRKDVDDYLRLRQNEFREENAATADYRQTADGQYETYCQIFDGDTCLLDLTLTVPTEREAQCISDNWNAKYRDVYARLIGALM